MLQQCVFVYYETIGDFKVVYEGGMMQNAKVWYVHTVSPSIMNNPCNGKSFPALGTQTASLVFTHQGTGSSPTVDMPLLLFLLHIPSLLSQCNHNDAHECSSAAPPVVLEP